MAGRHPRPARRRERGLRHRRDHGQLHRAGRWPPRRASTPAGTSRRWTLRRPGDQRRPRRTRRTRRSSWRCGCSAWAPTGSCGSRSTTRAGCVRTRCARRSPRLDGPTIICAQAGNVNTGAFDPLRPIGATARERAAPGSTSTARSGCGRPPSQRSAHLTDGIELRRLLGDRCAQVAQRAVRLRARAHCATPKPIARR